MGSHVPLRTCVACHQVRPAMELWRFSVDNATIQCDEDRCAGGRGAYVCMSDACVNRAVKRHDVQRSLRVKGMEVISLPRVRETAANG